VSERRAEPVPLSRDVAEHTLATHAHCDGVLRIDVCTCGCCLALWCGYHFKYVLLFALQLPLCEHGHGMVELVDDDGEGRVDLP
jgi:hypothetical protein